MEYYSVIKKNKLLTYVTIWMNLKSWPCESHLKLF